MQNRVSGIFLLIAVSIILLIHAYYPKWSKAGPEATLSWDVSGYYMYLPAIFIYKDIKEASYKDEIIKKYHPTSDFYQAFLHEKSGNYVMKYSIGQAVVFSPFFAVAHLWALNDARYPADGFSFPYQFCISMGSLIIAIIGLIFLRKVLLTYFEDKTAGLTILGIVIGSNYLNYAAIDGAMTHNTLFTIYSILIYVTIRFHENPTFIRSIGIGLCVGLAALIRPTEIISVLVPLLWGLGAFKKEKIFQRIHLYSREWSKLLLAIMVALGIGSLQLFYWKYVSGEWLVYSYEDEGFSWLSPHIIDGLFSFKSGWLLYSPFMLFSLIGFIPLFRREKELFTVTIIFSILFIYITFSWDNWWYGGSLGQRAMVQAYPILAFPLAAFIARVRHSRDLTKVIVGVIAIFFIYANLWFTHQAHKGGLLYVGEMNKRYFWKTLFRYERDAEDIKLLDGVKRVFKGERENVKTIYRDSTYHVKLNGDKKISDTTRIMITELLPSYDWLRVSIDAVIQEKEWGSWYMTQFIVNLKKGSHELSRHMIRVQRNLPPHQISRVYIDIQKPPEAFTEIDVQFWNVLSEFPIEFHDLRVEIYDEK